MRNLKTLLIFVQMLALCINLSSKFFFIGNSMVFVYFLVLKIFATRYNTRFFFNPRSRISQITLLLSICFHIDSNAQHFSLLNGKFSFFYRSFAASGRSRVACSRWRSPRLAPKWTRWRCPACARAPTPTAVPSTTWTWALSLGASIRTMLCAPTAATACDVPAHAR